MPGTSPDWRLDEEFEDLVVKDLSKFCNSDHQKAKVLVFPPLTDHHRFLIHRVVQDINLNLHSFSIGSKESRRTVVCDPLLLLKGKKYKNEQLEARKLVQQARAAASLKSELKRKALLEMERSKKRPSQQIYVPTGRSNQSSGECTSNTKVNDANSKRPIGRGRARTRQAAELYVPRAIRMAREKENSQIVLESNSKKHEPSPYETHTVSDSGEGCNEQGVDSTCDSNLPNVGTSGTNNCAVSSDQIEHKMEDIEYNQPALTVNGSEETNDFIKYEGGLLADDAVQLPSSRQQENIVNENTNPLDEVEQKSCSTPDNPTSQSIAEDKQVVESIGFDGSPKLSTDADSTQTEDDGTDSQVSKSNDLNDVDESATNIVPTTTEKPKSKNKLKKELKKEQKKKKHNKDVKPKETGQKTKSAETVVKEKECTSTPMETTIQPNATGDVNTGDTAEDAEDSWDTMFDDDGECLNSDLMKELEAAVGKVKIKKPVIDYLEYSPKDPELDDEQYGHLVELYGFPESFKTADLVNIFGSTKSGDFDVKWVDDTHAIGIYSSHVAAQDALMYEHPIVKCRPISQASRETKIKAKRCSDFMLPSKERPATTAMAARRIVSTSLGLSPQISKEQRLKEKQQLKEAKEKKRSDMRAKESIWDGTVDSDDTEATENSFKNGKKKWDGVFGKCAMDEV